MNPFGKFESNMRQNLVDTIKNLGIKDKVTQDSLSSWLSEYEKEIDALDSREKQVKFEMERAALYFDAGFEEEAGIAMYDAYVLAEGFGLEELKKEIKRKLGYSQ